MTPRTRVTAATLADLHRSPTKETRLNDPRHSGAVGHALYGRLAQGPKITVAQISATRETGSARAHIAQYASLNLDKGVQGVAVSRFVLPTEDPGVHSADVVGTCPAARGGAFGIPAYARAREPRPTTTTGLPGLTDGRVRIACVCKRRRRGARFGRGLLPALPHAAIANALGQDAPEKRCSH